MADRGCGKALDENDKDVKARCPVEDLRETSTEERVKEIMEEEDTPSFGGDDSSDGQDSSEESPEQDSSGPESGNDADATDDSSEESSDKDDGKEEEEDFEAKDLDDFMKKTETKVKIQKVACEPSPIFGPNDVNKHNKFKVTLTNEKGSVWIYFWDSVANTESGKQSSQDEMIAEFGRGCSAVKDGQSLDEFIHSFGYDLTEKSRVQKDYDGCRKLYDRCKKMFDEKQIDELIRLSNDV